MVLIRIICVTINSFLAYHFFFSHYLNVSLRSVTKDKEKLNSVDLKRFN